MNEVLNRDFTVMTEFASQVPCCRATPLASVVALIMASLILPAVIGAVTLRVERDGSGDYMTIQPAVDAAAAGDTILIGPGYYTEYQTVVLPGGGDPVDVYVYVRTDELTILGTEPVATIIGPDVPNFINFGPKGIVAVQNARNIAIAGLGFRNLREGVHCYLESMDVVDFRTFSWA